MTLAVLTTSPFIMATEQPYIDEIKSKLEPAPDEGSYTDRIKKELGDDSSSVDYTKKIKESLDTKKEDAPYTDQIKSTLKPSETGGAIKALQEGKSELKMRREGHIKYAAGFRIGTVISRNFKTPLKDKIAFQNMFGSKWKPDFSVLAEIQPFRSETWGNFGFYSSFGLSYFSGSGTFQFTLNNPVSGQSFGASAQTNFKLYVLPLSAGGSIRLNLAHYVRPYAMVGPAVVGYVQSRDDDKPGKRGYSTGYLGTAGVAILLDWLSRSSTWALYENHSIKHFYLTAEYLVLQATQGPISFSASGVYSGFTYEM